MSEADDFSAPLTAEILSDVATRFFDARRELERAIELFNELATLLRQKRDEVLRRSGTLNFLLLRGKGSRAFYHALKVEEPGPLLAPQAVPGVPPPRIPRVLGGARRYARMVSETYAELQIACEVYRCGSADTRCEATADIRDTASYQFTQTLCQEINRRIARASAGMTPTDTLQYARRLTAGDSQTIAPLPGYAQRLEEQLAYRPIVFKSLGLPPFPSLPPPSGAHATITTFCHDLYQREGPRIQDLFVEIRRCKVVRPPPIP